MSKIFTITEGLENMGALRTGGQGSVYKARRIGEIISAVKLMPTPIHSEDKANKNYRDFINEVEKLKKVNEIPNPNVVKILSSGLTESGSFPFIEMEFIEGPDLQELLVAPNAPVFSVRELVKIANQLSNALAHCHKVGVKHGDVKSNNVKFNLNTGNYVLLDFGLAIMSDEQRRTSLRHAGAIEFMAPEQNEGKMLFESDVYSFGVILYELIAGVVPFPLNDKSETARNKVMISHMESPVPDVLTQRNHNLPKTWGSEKNESEMRVPVWLLETIGKCLEKEPSRRFKNGIELHESIINHYTTDIGNVETLGIKNELLERENQELKTRVAFLAERPSLKEFSTDQASSDTDTVNLSRPVFYGILLLLVGLAIFTAYTLYNKPAQYPGNQISSSVNSIGSIDSTSTVENQPDRQPRDNHDKEIRALIDSVQNADSLNDTLPEASDASVEEEQTVQNPEPTTTNESTIPRAAKYTLSATRAYFYEEPRESAKGLSFLARSNSPELTALADRNGFIYVVFFTVNGQVSKGWLRKRDLRKLGSS